MITCVKEKDGITRYLVDGVAHREDGPAIVQAEFEFNRELFYNHEMWMHRGVVHREGGPAVTAVYNDKPMEMWFSFGKLHRTDGPAVTKSYKKIGTEENWCLNGQLHREDGPALIKRLPHETLECWYLHGKLHREDGPAVVIHVEVSDMKNCFARRVFCFEQNYAIADWFDMYTCGNLFLYYQHGRLHRADGPAIYNVTESQIGTAFHFEHGHVKQRTLRNEDPLFYFHGRLSKNVLPNVQHEMCAVCYNVKELCMFSSCSHGLCLDCLTNVLNCVFCNKQIIL